MIIVHRSEAVISLIYFKVTKVTRKLKLFEDMQHDFYHDINPKTPNSQVIKILIYLREYSYKGNDT